MPPSDVIEPAASCAWFAGEGSTCAFLVNVCVCFGRFCRQRFLPSRSAASTLMFPSQAFGYFLLLSLFSLLFFLAFLEGLWASTGHGWWFPF